MQKKDKSSSSCTAQNKELIDSIYCAHDWTDTGVCLKCGKYDADYDELLYGFSFEDNEKENGKEPEANKEEKDNRELFQKQTASDRMKSHLFHHWNGCVCRICGKHRDEDHDWNGCVCRRCGKHRDEGHDWSDTGFCLNCGEYNMKYDDSIVRCPSCGSDHYISETVEEVTNGYYCCVDFTCTEYYESFDQKRCLKCGNIFDRISAGCGSRSYTC